MKKKEIERSGDDEKRMNEFARILEGRDENEARMGAEIYRLRTENSRILLEKDEAVAKAKKEAELATAAAVDEMKAEVAGQIIGDFIEGLNEDNYTRQGGGWGSKAYISKKLGVRLSWQKTKQTRRYRRELRARRKADSDTYQHAAFPGLTLRKDGDMIYDANTSELVGMEDENGDLITV